MAYALARPILRSRAASSTFNSNLSSFGTGFTCLYSLWSIVYLDIQLINEYNWNSIGQK
jgi:hypothetical protein